MKHLKFKEFKRIVQITETKIPFFRVHSLLYILFEKHEWTCSDQNLFPISIHPHGKTESTIGFTENPRLELVKKNSAKTGHNE